jgi:hypothetical protein
MNATYGRKAWAVVAYVFHAEILCPECTLKALPTDPGQEFDGWRDATGRMTAEENLTELALAFGIDRADERSFDSDEFPKVVFSSDLGDGESCGNCGTEL